MNQFPFQMVPIAMPQQQAERAPILGNEVPARVHVAMEFLHRITIKTMPKVAVADMGRIEVIDGQSLTTAESNAQATACNMLNDFFLGKLRSNDWEKEYVSNSKVIESSADDKPGTLLNCPACYPNTKPSCNICHGLGTIMALPVSRNNGEGPR